MNNYISLINGEFKDSISVLDRGLSYGDGFFETMIWEYEDRKDKDFQGVEFWNRHLRRIETGCKLTKINFPNSKLLRRYREKILSKAYAEGLSKGLLKIIITRGVGGRGYKYENKMMPTIIFLVFPKSEIDEKFYKRGVVVRYCKSSLFQNKELFGLKHLNRLDSVIARSEWTEDFFEGVFLDHKSNLVEGTMTNIFFVKNKTLYTPPIVGNGIYGIMRKVVIEKARLFYDDIKIMNVNKEKLKKYDEMFVTNSVIKIMPVKRLGKKKFNISDRTKGLIDFFFIENKIEKKKRLEFF